MEPPKCKTAIQQVLRRDSKCCCRGLHWGFDLVRESFPQEVMIVKKVKERA